MVVKYMGRDCELSTTGLGLDGQAVTNWNVVRDILAQIGPALRARGAVVWCGDVSRGGTGYGSFYSTDCLRNWASNGQCYYSDMGHVEVCTAPTARPKHFAAQCISTLLVAEEARKRAQSEANEDLTLALSASNADVFDPAVSWGTHLNASITNRLWEDLCLYHNRPAVLGFVASAIAAAIPFFGVGYLLPMKDGSTVYSLSGRTHHISSIKTLSTTEEWHRGLLNSRREPWGEDQDRLHLIGFDYSIISAALLCSFLQCVLTAAEEGYCGLNIYDPVRALRTWSWGLDTTTGRMAAKAATVDGRKLSLSTYMGQLTAALLDMCESGLISDEVAPDAVELLPMIAELTRYAEEGSVNRCAKHLDWAAKLMCLLGGSCQWGSAAARLADHDFANTDPERGVLWQLWDEGLVDPLVTKDDALMCLKDGPVETRAWARGQLIRRFSESISSVNWDHVELHRTTNRWGPRLRVEMPHLDSLNRQIFEPIIRRARDVLHLEELLKHNTQGAAHEVDPIVDVSHQLALPSDPAGAKHRN
jgi:pup-ligase protein